MVSNFFRAGCRLPIILMYLRSVVRIDAFLFQVMMQSSPIRSSVHNVIIPIEDLLLGSHVFCGRNSRSTSSGSSGAHGSAERDGVFGDFLNDATIVRRS